MARELHKLKGKNLYALYSTVVDSYITDFAPKEVIRKIWLDMMIKDDREKIKRYMNEIDREVTLEEVKATNAGCR